MSEINPYIFTEEQKKSLATELCKGATNGQIDLFFLECERRKAMPGKHIIFQLRTAKERDERGQTQFVKRPVHTTTIDFLRLLAERSGKYKGQKAAVYIYIDDKSMPELRSTVPLPAGKVFWAAEKTVLRVGDFEPATVVARFDAYAVTYKSGDTEKLTAMWERRGPEQLAKCAEALALRQAFPEELGGLYISEELRDEAEDAPKLAIPISPITPAPEPAAPPAPVNAAPAQEITKSSSFYEQPSPPQDLVSPAVPPSVPPSGEEASVSGEKPESSSAGTSSPAAESYHATDMDLPAGLFDQAPAPEPMAPAAPPVEDRKPTATELAEFHTRAKKYTQEILPKGGMKPVKGMGVSKKLRQYFLNYYEKASIDDLTVNNWSHALEALDITFEKSGAKGAVEFVENVIAEKKG